MLDKPHDYLIDRILPHREVHLLGGPSGAGKSTWFLQTFVNDWQHGRDVLGYHSHPVPWLYVSGDRSMDGVLRTLERLAIKRTDITVFSAVDNKVTNIGLVIARAMKHTTPPQFIFFEGMASMMAASGYDPNKYKDTSTFLIELTTICKEHNIAIMGSCHSPKMKEDSQYLNPRQRIMGSAAWAAYSETIIMIEPVKPDDPTMAPLRRLYLLPRNEAEQSFDLQFNSDGRLVEAAVELDGTLFGLFLSKVGHGNTFKTEQIQEQLQAAGISRSSITRYLTRAVNDGILTKVAQGSYRVNRIA